MNQTWEFYKANEEAMDEAVKYFENFFQNTCETAPFEQVANVLSVPMEIVEAAHSWWIGIGA